MGSKKTSQTQTTHQVTTPNIPDWANTQVSGLNDKITQFGQMDPYSLIPQQNAYQTQARNYGAGLMGDGGLFKQAGDLYSGVGSAAAPQVQSASLLDGLDKYYNPFKDQVLNPLMADQDQQAGQTRAAQSAAAARNGAFRGSRYGVQEAQTEGELSRARAATLGGALNQMYDTSTNLSSQDAGRRQSASEANANLTMQQRQQQLAAGQGLQGLGAQNTSLLEGLGQDQYNQDLQHTQAPFQQLSQQSGLFNSLNPSSYFGSTSDGTNNTTSKQSSSTGQILGTLAMLAAAPLKGGTSLLGMGLGGLGLSAGAAAAGSAALGGLGSGLMRT